MEQHVTTITISKNSVSPARQKQIKEEFAAAGVVAIFIPYDPQHPMPALDRFIGSEAIKLAPMPEAGEEA